MWITRYQRCCWWWCKNYDNSKSVDYKRNKISFQNIIKFSPIQCTNVVVSPRYIVIGVTDVELSAWIFNQFLMKKKYMFCCFGDFRPISYEKYCQNFKFPTIRLLQHNFSPFTTISHDTVQITLHCSSDVRKPQSYFDLKFK